MLLLRYGIVQHDYKEVGEFKERLRNLRISS
jgi:hypothetical protein